MYAAAFLLAAIVALVLASIDQLQIRRACIVVAAALPILAGLAIDRQAPAFGDVRLRLNSVGFNDESLVRPARIGGDPGADDLYVPGLPPTLAWIGPGGALAAAPTRGLSTAPKGAPIWSEAAIVSVDHGRSQSFVGAYPVSETDRFCLERCSADDATWYRIGGEGTRLERDGAPGTDLPLFRKRQLHKLVGDFLADTLVFYRPGQMIFPMRDYGRPWLGRPALDENPCATRFACDRSTGKPLRSFLFRDGSRQMHLALLDRDAVLERGDASAGVPRITAAAAVPARLGGPTKADSLTVWQVNYADASLDFTEAKRPSYLVRRRVLRPSMSNGRLELVFLREPTSLIDLGDIRDHATRLERGRLRTPVAISLAGARPDGETPPSGNVIVLEHVGGGLAKAIDPTSGNAASLIFGDSFTGNRAVETALPGVGGAIEVQPPRFGKQVFRIGDSEADGGGRSATLTVDRFTFPHLLLPVLIAWAMLFGSLQLRIWSESRAAVILTLCLQLLLLSRIMVAVGSAALDPQIDYQAGLANALIAYCAVPLAMAGLFPARMPARFDYWPTALALLLLIALLYRTAPAHDFMTAAGAVTGLLVMARAFLGPALAIVRRSPPATWIVTAVRQPRVRAILTVLGKALRAPAILARSLVEAVRAVRRRLLAARLIPEWLKAQGRRIVIPRQARPFLLLALALFLVRLLLLLSLNVKERAGIGLSVVYLPLALYACGGLIAAMRRSTGDPATAKSLYVWSMVTAGLLFVVVPVLVSDSGFMLYLIAILLIVPLYLPPAPTRQLRELVVAPALVLIAVGTVFVWTAATASLPSTDEVVAEIRPSDQQAVPDKKEVLARLDAYSARTQNLWRIDALVRPDALNEAGTTEAEQLRRWRFLLTHFSSHGTGFGMPYEADIADLRPVQADDNVSAVHLMGPFGRAGAAMFLLLVGIVALTAPRTSPALTDAWRVGAELALWTIFVAGAYMILANLLLVPFTGRNIYLLAAHSKSDLLEGSALFAMAFAGLVSRPWRLGKTDG